MRTEAQKDRGIGRQGNRRTGGQGKMRTRG